MNNKISSKDYIFGMLIIIGVWAALLITSALLFNKYVLPSFQEQTTGISTTTTSSESSSSDDSNDESDTSETVYNPYRGSYTSQETLDADTSWASSQQ